MKKTLSIILIITMLLSTFLMAIPAYAETAVNAAAAATAVQKPALPNKGVTTPATGATTVTEPALPAIGTAAGQANIGNTVVAKTDSAYKAARAAEGYIPIVNAIVEGTTPAGAVLWNGITNGTRENPKKYYLWEDISAPDGGDREYVVVDGCGHTVTRNGSLFGQTRGTFVFKNITFKANYAPGNGSQTMLSAWGSWGEVSLYNVTIDGKVTYKNTYSSQRGGLFNHTLTNKNGAAIISNVKINAELIIDSATTILPCIGLLAGACYDGVQFTNVVANGSITIKDGTVINADVKSGESQGTEWLKFIGGISGETTGHDNAGNPSKVENVYSNVDINIGKNVNITGVKRDGTYPESPTGVFIGAVFGNTNGSAIFKNVVNEGDITVGTGSKMRIYSMGGISASTTSASIYENCHNKGNITLYDGITMYNSFGIGGITGSQGDIDVTFKNCVNSGNIAVCALADGQTATDLVDTKINSIGGIVNVVKGVATIKTDVNDAANTYTFDTCFNKGNITLGQGVYSPYANDTQVEQGMGGIVGRITNNTAFKNCVNTGNIVSNGKIVRAFGGIAASGKQAINTSFVNCINDGDISINVRLGGRDYSSAAGIYAFQYKANASYLRIYSCTNNGDIKEVSTANVGDGKVMRAGIAAVVRGIKDVIIYNCINNGEILAGAQTHGENLGSGIVAFYATIGHWMGIKDTDSTFTIERTTNTGKVQSRGDAGGMLCRTAEIQGGASDATNNVIRYFTFKECLNTGAIERLGGATAGGIAGAITGNGYLENNTRLPAKLNVLFENCENTGAVTCAGNNAAGIIGYFTANNHAPRLVLKNCENTGKINGGSGSWNIGGIGGWLNTAATSPASVASNYTPGLYVEGCVNNGVISGHGNVCGIIGLAAGNDDAAVEIKNCYNGEKGTITANERLAGITGEIYRKNITFTNCYNLADITVNGTNDNAWGGGLVAKVMSGGTVTFTNCDNYGNVYAAKKSWYDSSAANKFNWASYGGVLGGIHNATSATFTDCDNYGEITLADGTVGPSLGGIVGQATNNTSAITVTFRNCTNNNKVTSGAVVEGNVDDRMGIGGIIGTAGNQFYNADVYFYGCTNNGDVKLTAAAKYYQAGGILGFLRNGSVTFDKNGDVNNTNNGNISAAGLGKEMIAIGGIVGRTGNTGGEVTANIKNCVNNGSVTVTGTTYSAAGIVGNLCRTKATVENCVNKGTVTDNCSGRTHYQGVGGVIGFAFGYYGDVNVGLNVNNCSNEGEIKVAPANSSAVGAAGIVGWARAIPVVKLDGCRNTGDVTSNKYASGMVGAYGTVGTWAKANKSSLEFVNCVNAADIKADWKAGGFVGNTEEISGSNNTDYVHDFIFTNCTNSGSVWSIDKAGGFISYLGINGKSAVKFIKCHNNANVTSRDGYVGGYLGELWASAANITFDAEDCVNTGDITSTNNGRVAGFFGSLCIGTGNAAQFTVNITDCVNDGDVTGKGGTVGGIVGYSNAGYTEGEAADKMSNYKITLTNVLNNGAIYAGANQAGGIYGGVVRSNANTVVRINNAINTGAVSAGLDPSAGGGNAAGIFGVKTGSGAQVYLDGVVNYGTITSKNWNCFGIFAQNEQDKTGAYSEVKNAVNFGKLNSTVAGNSKEAPIGHPHKMENAYFYIGSIDEGTVSSNGTPVSNFERAITRAIACCDMAFTFATLEAATPEAEPYFEKADKYAEDTLNNLREKYDASKAMIAGGFYSVNADREVVFLTQTAIEEQTEILLDAIENTYLKSAMPILLEDTIAKAEKFSAENTNLYKDEAWNRFVDALEAAKNMYAQGNLLDLDYAVIYPVVDELRQSMKALEDDEDTLGGDIYTAEEFAMLDGKTGSFVLMNDITVNKALENFNGIIYGNGHTITLDGCALALNTKGATVINLTILGNTGDAKSIFGAAKGTNNFDTLVIDVEGKLEAALFHAVDSKAQVAITTIISYADASVAALVAGDCTISAQKVLVMANAPALVTAAEANVILSYVNGTVYYNAEGEKITDAEVFASGEVTFVMNEALGLTDFLVQRIGDQKLPVIEAALIDGSNLVRFKDGEYYNLGSRVDVPVVTPGKPEAPVEIGYAELNSAIAKAEALKADDYTAESWAALTEALEAAKAALEADDQNTVDAAAIALEVAIISLEAKKADVAGLDLSKLNEAIAKAEALNVADYTTGSWSAVNVMLSMAKAAKIADTQAEIDAAVASLEAAIAALVKAPVVEEAPEADDKDDDNADEAPAEEGCGSVVGGAAVVAVAVLALGAGVTFKKKED